jgi:hypothetical protein
MPPPRTPPSDNNKAAGKAAVAVTAKAALDKDADAPEEPGDLVPPEPQFWQHYSPHHEFPISTLISISIYIAIGLFLLLVLAMRWGAENTEPIPIDSIEVGGEPGGGDPNGDPNTHDEPQFKAEQIQAPVTPLEKVDFQEVKPEDIKVMEIDPTVKPEESKVPQDNSLQALNEAMNQALRPKGTGPGTGGGPGGPGKGNPNQRTRRGLRWDLNMSVSSSADYLTKLTFLGAQIGYQKPGSVREVYLIKNPRAHTPPELTKVSEINRIFWFVEASMVPELSALLGLPKVPSALIVFFPQDLEEKLLGLETDAAKKAKGRDVKEDEIAETNFAVTFVGNSVRSITVRGLKFKR